MSRKSEQIKKVAIVYIITIIFMILIAIARNYTKFKDPFGGSVFKSKFLGNLTGESGVYSAWPISHFLLYAIIGYISPDLWWLWIAIGIAWELLEYGVGELISRASANDGGLDKVNKTYLKLFIHPNNSQYSGKWVKGCKSDILFNILGLMLGIIIAKITTRLSENYNSAKITYYTSRKKHTGLIDHFKLIHNDEKNDNKGG